MSTMRNVVTHGMAAMGAVAVVVMLGAGGGMRGAAAEPPAAPAGIPADMQKAMADYMKTTKPSERHQFLQQFVGEWDTTMKVFMDPASPPMETKGHAKNEMIHGGRFLKQEFTGSMKMPGPDGKMVDLPMVGLGLNGYDNNRKLYTMMWTDTNTTAMLTGRGNVSPDGKMLTIFGEMDEPMTGEVGKAVKYVTRVVDKDTYVFEVSEVLYGDPFKVVEVEYKRQAKK